jgi:FkbM family methyltransferase
VNTHDPQTGPRPGGGWLRSVRESALGLLYGRRGMPRPVNGATFRVLPRYRSLFPPEYDAPVAAFLRERVRPGMTCVNVGANLGIYALQFAHWSAPDGRVVAFEPNPSTARVLRRHVVLNGMERRVRVVEAAVASAPGRATFFMAAEDGMSRLGEPNPLLPATEPIQVEVTTLDRFLATEGVRPDWILVDVEGFEVAVLQGARETLRARPGTPGVVLEMHPDAWRVAGTSRADLEDLLADLGLRPAPLTGQADPLADYGLVHLVPR